MHLNRTPGLVETVGTEDQLRDDGRTVRVDRAVSELGLSGTAAATVRLATVFDLTLADIAYVLDVDKTIIESVWADVVTRSTEGGQA